MVSPNATGGSAPLANPHVGKRVAIVQSSYIPWKGYFDLIGLVDEFILLEDVQYTHRDWRNRNRIKTAAGVAWLTIPVEVKGRYEQRVDEVRVVDSAWAKRHWQTVRHAYGAAPCFVAVSELLERLWGEATNYGLLTEINEHFLRGLCRLLAIETPITRSTDYDPRGRATERLVSVCQGAGATTYLSGPAARSYLEEALFCDAGVEVEWMDYSDYRAYPQVHGEFEHKVSVIDLLVHTGQAAPGYLNSYVGA